MTRMVLTGNTDQVDGETEHWSSHKERLEQFITANDAAQDKLITALLSVVGSNTCELLCMLTTPTKSVDKTFTELWEI